MTKYTINKSQFYGVLFALPCIIGFVFFAAIPMLSSLVLSFTNYMVSNKIGFIGLRNYKNMFSGVDPYFYQALKVTFIYVLFSVPTSLIFAFFVAMLLNQNIKGKAIFRTIFYIPSIVPAVAMCAIWMWIFNPDLGLANTILKTLHLPTSNWLYGRTSVLPTLIFVNLWTTGSTMIIFLAGLQDVPKQLLEAAEIDGGGPLVKLFHVIIPMMTPTIFYNLIMGVINGFQVFTQAYVMTNGGPDNASLFYVFYLYREAFQFSKLGSACAIAWVLFIIITIFSAVLFKVSHAWVFYGSGDN